MRSKAGRSTGRCHLEQVVVSRVDGDVNIFTAYSEIDGTIVSGLRAMAGELNVRGAVEGNVLAFTTDLRFASEASVGGTLVARGGLVDLAGRFEGPVQIGAGVAKLSGRFGHDVKITCDELVLSPETRIEGNLT